MTSLAEGIVRYSDLLGPSGEEDRVAAAFVRDLRAFGLEAAVDAFANVTVPLAPHDPTRRTVMVSAHLDEVGFVVRRIDRDGYLRVHRVGGTHDRVVAGQRLTFLGEDGPVPGVVGVKAKHLSAPDELARSVGVDDAYVDVFAASADEARAMGLSVGTLGVFDASARVVGDRVSGKALDDRVGIAVLIALAERLHAAETPWNVVLLATAQEEFSVRGGVSAARRIDPDLALCVDVAIATDTPDSGEHGDVALGAGPVLTRFTRASLNGIIPNPSLRRFASGVAEGAGIDLQQGVLQGGLTDASFMQHVGRGIPSLDVSFPCRYTHTPVETVSLRDVGRLTDWIEAMLGALADLPDLTRRAG